MIFLAGCCLAEGGCGSALEAERLASRYCKHMPAQNDTQNDTPGWATFHIGCPSWPNTVLGAFGVCGNGEFCRTNITILLCFPLYLRRWRYHEYCNAAFVSIITSICKDLGSCYVIQDYWNALYVPIWDQCMPSRITGMQRLYRFLQAYVTIWDHLVSYRITEMHR